MTKITKEIVNVEFGNEFGDMNAAKQYEVPASNQDHKKKSKKKK
ncbi:hypothetical protein [Bacillus dakarensis]|nr:hypothetical protein [Bacillus dakarensis]